MKFHQASVGRKRLPGLALGEERSSLLGQRDDHGVGIVQRVYRLLQCLEFSRSIARFTRIETPDCGNGAVFRDLVVLGEFPRTKGLLSVFWENRAVKARGNQNLVPPLRGKGLYLDVVFARFPARPLGFVGTVIGYNVVGIAPQETIGSNRHLGAV